MGIIFSALLVCICWKCFIIPEATSVMRAVVVEGFNAPPRQGFAHNNDPASSAHEVSEESPFPPDGMPPASNVVDISTETRINEQSDMDHDPAEIFSASTSCSMSEHMLSTSAGLHAKEAQPDAFSNFLNELVYTVAELLPDSDLMNFALLSRRLHFLVIPIYLHLQGFCIPEVDEHLSLSGPVIITALKFWRFSSVFQCPRILSIAISDSPTEYDHLRCFFSSLDCTSALQTVQFRLASPPAAALIELLETLGGTRVQRIAIWHYNNKICQPPRKCVLPPTHLSLPSLTVFEP
ncbi:uncharacterized protein LAESUDRAFT_756337 [Laetiporus sulphureus 93-53]|uniref:F-box domain-containing protein n=1 Tax=Laetiporus sulphureus 93-53 TaxID=1314785 RepID=A0A165GC96_9APHY|nr:uncharacterized protein LAESUDRAFT_756337 [Laetiporus sulphureus 93-53]KZT10148.1 hypothetical protein LAESUDRAFT_756337 [Laetiporus sulphureus 93-53]